MDEDSIEVVDATTLNINLLKPFAPYDAVLPWLFVANPTIVQEHDVDGDEGEAWLKENEAGGGPFTIARWESAIPMSSRAIRTTGSTRRTASSRSTASSGASFASRRPSASPWRRARSSTATGSRPRISRPWLPTGNFVANETPSLTPFAIKLNNQVGPTSDINVRKALSHAFDYDAALEAVSGRGAIMEGPLASGLEPWHKKDLPVLAARHGGGQGGAGGERPPRWLRDGVRLRHR